MGPFKEGQGKMSPSLFDLSPEDLVECDRTSYMGVTNNGCFGGHFLPAFVYAQNKGMTLTSCSPYTYGRVPFPYPPASPCQQTRDYPTSPKTNKPRRKATSFYRVSGVTNIMREVYENGPVSAQVTLYGDFYYYPQFAEPDSVPVYKWNKATAYRGGHGVIIVGWGTTAKGVDYWIVTNTYGTRWSNQGGYIYIKRGNNEIGIEGVVAGAKPEGTPTKPPVDPGVTVTVTVKALRPLEREAVLRGARVDVVWESTVNQSGKYSTMSTKGLEEDADDQQAPRTVSTAQAVTSVKTTIALMRGTTLVATLATGVTGSSWGGVVPSSVPAGVYTVKLSVIATVTDGTTGTGVTQSHSFSIVATAVSLKITSPTTGATWSAGMTQTITFTTSCSECGVRAVMRRTDTNAIISSSAWMRASGQLSLSVPSSTPALSNKYAIELYGLGTPHVQALSTPMALSDDDRVHLRLFMGYELYSDDQTDNGVLAARVSNISVGGQSVPQIVFTRPAGPIASANREDQIQLAWTISGVASPSTLSLALALVQYPGGGSPSNIATLTGASSYTFKIPKDHALGQYMFSLTPTKQTNVGPAYSSYIDIGGTGGGGDGGNIPKHISVSWPSAATAWTCACSCSGVNPPVYNVTWTSSKVSWVDVELWQSGAKLATLATRVPATGKAQISVLCEVMTFVTGATSAVGQIIVRENGGTLFGTGDIFTIKRGSDCSASGCASTACTFTDFKALSSTGVEIPPHTDSTEWTPITGRYGLIYTGGDQLISGDAFRIAVTHNLLVGTTIPPRYTPPIAIDIFNDAGATLATLTGAWSTVYVGNASGRTATSTLTTTLPPTLAAGKYRLGVRSTSTAGSPTACTTTAGLKVRLDSARWRVHAAPSGRVTLSVTGTTGATISTLPAGTLVTAVVGVSSSVGTSSVVPVVELWGSAGACVGSGGVAALPEGAKCYLGVLVKPKFVSTSSSVHTFKGAFSIPQLGPSASPWVVGASYTARVIVTTGKSFDFADVGPFKISGSLTASAQPSELPVPDLDGSDPIPEEESEEGTPGPDPGSFSVVLPKESTRWNPSEPPFEIRWNTPKEELSGLATVSALLYQGVFYVTRIDGAIANTAGMRSYFWSLPTSPKDPKSLWRLLKLADNNGVVAPGGAHAICYVMVRGTIFPIRSTNSENFLIGGIPSVATPQELPSMIAENDHTESHIAGVRLAWNVTALASQVGDGMRDSSATIRIYARYKSLFSEAVVTESPNSGEIEWPTSRAVLCESTGESSPDCVLDTGEAWSFKACITTDTGEVAVFAPRSRPMGDTVREFVGVWPESDRCTPAYAEIVGDGTRQRVVMGLGAPPGILPSADRMDASKYLQHRVGYGAMAVGLLGVLILVVISIT